MDTSIIYLTVKELAKEAGVPQAQVRQHVQEGLLDSTVGQNTGRYYRAYDAYDNSEQTEVAVSQATCRAYLFTPDQVEAYVDLMKDFVPEDGRKNAEHPKHEGSKANKGLSCELAAKVCGVSGTTIRMAVKAGAIKTLNKMPIRISMYIAKKYAKELEDRIALGEASMLLNMTTSGVRSLISAGRLTRTFPYMGQIYLSRKEVNAAAQRYTETHRDVPMGVHPQMRRIK